MKREIKFRAWDDDRMIYWSLADLHGSDIGELRADVYCEYEDLTNVVKGDKIMQYTGLLDRNNVEIYEGDIVSCADIIVAVTWKDAAFHIITNESQGASIFVQNRAKHFEVIGNIYENPELLKYKTMNKLADRIAKEKLTKYSDGHYTQFNGHENILMAMAEAMQAYHEAANKAVTDEDIEAYIDAHEVDDPILRKALRVGAGAMRDGLIKHIEP